MDGNYTRNRNCSEAKLTRFSKNVRGQMWRANALLIVNAILMGVMVGIGAYGQSYCHYPLTRLLFLAATALFLPIVSNVVSNIDNQLMDGKYHIRNCSRDAVAVFKKSMSERMGGSIRGQMWKVNALLVVNAILAGVMVGIGAYGQRYRHHPLTRFLFLGATTLFLPVVSYVVSTIGNGGYFNREEDIHQEPFVTVQCSTDGALVIVWTALVQIVGISTSAVVVAGDAREGRNVGPPTVLLVQAIWTTYLALRAVGTSFGRSRFEWQNVYGIAWLILMLPFALIFAKLVFKFYAFYEAQLSFSLGRNPRVVVGYMEQLQDGRQHADPASVHIPPPFIVIGEQTLQVEEQPHGYRFTRLMSESDQGDRTEMDNNGLVTIEKVWQLDDMLLRSIPRLKDVCFSFSLFKLLRCRFAGYTAAEAGFTKADNFLWQVLLKDNDHERVLGVITDELSFLHDYYYSSLPISYSKHWLPVFNIFTSLLTISYCLFAGIVVFAYCLSWQGQLTCWIECTQLNGTVDVDFDPYSYGSLYFDLVPVILLLALVVLAEARDIASYICSNWTKVGLICRYVVNCDTWQRSPSMQKFVGRVLRCRCKLTMKQWDNKMNQCSVLVLHPTKTHVVLLMRLLHLPDQKKNVKVPAVVKAAIVDALRSNDGLLSNGASFLRHSLQDGADNLLWACNGKGTADIMLMWHIATSILEVKHPHPHPPASDHKIIATHLSRYCAYLVAYAPELLPDDDPWCKSLYKAVKKDSDRVLAGGVAVEYGKLVALLSETSEHELLKKGVRLVKQLVESTESEETAWRVLAGFWSEMILYVAPSDNLNGHAEAIARGGELITLVWALLMHAGIVTRPSAAEGAPAATSV